MVNYYQWYKDAGVCPRCMKNPCADNRSACLECLAKDAEKKREQRARMTADQRKTRNKKINQLRAKRYENRKAQGLCVTCGKRAPAPNRVRCGICLAKARRAAQNHREKIGVVPMQIKWENGCICGKPSMQGKKVCADCYAKLVKNAEKGKESQKAKGYRWEFR